MPADGLLAGAAGVEGAGAGEAAAEAAGSAVVTAGEAADTTGGLREGGVTGAVDTTMAGTLLETVRERTKKQKGET